VPRGSLKCVPLLALLSLAAGAHARGLEPLDACGALAASADETDNFEDMVKKLSGGFSVAQAVAKCNQNKKLCLRVRNDLQSRKKAVPKGLTCSTRR
jgi:hypothetical protein